MGEHNEGAFIKCVRKMLGFCDLVPLYELAAYLYYKIHATSLFTYTFPWPPYPPLMRTYFIDGPWRRYPMMMHDGRAGRASVKVVKTDWKDVNFHPKLFLAGTRCALLLPLVLSSSRRRRRRQTRHPSIRPRRRRRHWENRAHRSLEEQEGKNERRMKSKFVYGRRDLPKLLSNKLIMMQVAPKVLR